jgi:4-carboxymuconolactone decarboxylase
MYLPDIYDKFRQQYDDIFQKYDQLGQACREAGPLERKIQDLVKLGIAIGANSQGAVRSHTRKALASGATPEEIIHAVLLSLTTTGFPNMIAAMGWVRQVLEKESSQ